jgi:23S rRNA (guanosine2251-2'-O)-methyltransferase
MKKLKTTELNRKSPAEYKTFPKISLLIVLDNLRSMFNVGSIFRTCDAYLVEKIILCGITPQPPHREIHKTALGATETVQWTYFKEVKEAIAELKGLGYQIIGIEQTDKSIDLNDINIEKDRKYALIFGNEIDGISESIVPYLDQCIDLPQYGTKHSLNVSVAAGIVIYNFARKLIR